MTNHVLFEIGLEELPARFIDDAEKQLYEKTTNWLTDLRINYQSVRSFSTPRRLAVLIEGVAEQQETVQEEVRGPSEKIAKDAEGNWSKAAIGFTKGQGKTTDDIYTKDIKGTTYIFVEKHIEGKPTKELLPLFNEIIEAIQFKENMRWGEGSFRYARPMRWLVGLYNDQVIPFEVAGVKADQITYGHRFLGEKITLNHATQYQERLRDNFVIADPKEREQLIVTGIQELEQKEKFQIVVEEDLLQEVRNLVEYPTVFCGSFEESFLKLPTEVLITSMKEHQRYFPVKSADNALLPYFVSVRNGDDYEIKTVIRGNEKVLYARLSDGQFFYEEDQKQSIDTNVEKLERVVFQEKLGTVSDKVKRVRENVKQLADKLLLDSETAKKATRAAEISKFDLMTNMVNEFTELQGIIGEKYALHFGEDATVAQAIREHYLPNQAQGKLPESAEGALVSIADKMDTIVGFISVGLTPTGSQDPYSIRRQAIGVLRILDDRKWNISLESIVNIALNQYELASDETIINACRQFFKLRATYLLKELAIEQDVIEAVLQDEIGILSYTTEKARLLSKKRNEASFKEIEEALVRVLNLAKKREDLDIDPTLFETESEEILYKQYKNVYDDYIKVNKQGGAAEALAYLSELASPIHMFFEHNMVMTDDEQLRNNRLALLYKIAFLIDDFADLSAIQWKQHH